MAAFAAANTCIGFWIGEPRYLLAAFPLFVLLGWVRNPSAQALIAGSSLLAMVVLALGFTSGRWAF